MFMRTYASSRVKRKSFLLRDSENDLYKQVVWDQNNWLWFVFSSYRTAQVLKIPNQEKDLCLILALWQDYT